MSVRNRCEFEHCLCPKPPTREDVERNLRLVKEILVLAKALGLELVDLEKQLEPYRFPAF